MPKTRETSADQGGTYMTRPRRTGGVVTVRRVAVALLIGAFSKELLDTLRWMAMVRPGPAGEADLRALLLATVSFAIDVALIYLVLRGLGSMLQRRRRNRRFLPAEGAGAGDPTFVSEEFEPAGAEGLRRGKGGTNDRDSDHG